MGDDRGRRPATMRVFGDPTKPSIIPHHLQPMLAGACAGVTAKTCVAPLDRVKILFQTRSQHYPFHGVLRTLARIRALEGMRGLYKGHLTMVMRIAPYAGVQFSAYERLKSVRIFVGCLVSFLLLL
jgi:Mitochondrial carrier protein